MESPAYGSKKSWQWYWMPTVVFLIGMFSIILLLWVNRINERARMDALIVDAIMDVQIKVSTSHLWLEEAVSGDNSADEALADLNKAINLVNVIINGGKSEHGFIPKPLTDRELRGHVEALGAMLLNFKMFSLERLRNPGEAGIASSTEQKFDVAFKAILKKAGALEEMIKENDAEDRAKSGHLFLGVLFAWAFIVVAATVGFWSREKQRKSAEEALVKSHEQLISQAEELTRHREHLTELVEMRTAELTSANEQLRTEISERRRMEGEVRKLNDELERKIEERTGQLIDAQQELVRSEKLAMLGRIAEAMGNELRNPLGVMNNAIFLLKSVTPESDGTVRDYLNIVENEIGNSQGIISDLLDFCQATTPNREVVPVRDLIEQGLAKCAIPENIRLRADLPELPLAARIDLKQMGQALHNLIANAVQAMPDGGTLCVATRRIRNSECGIRNEENNSALRTPHSALDEDFVEISVADTGIGIAPAHMEKLFQPLFSTRSRGLGLGLAFCKKLTEANGGRIAVESRVGEGTTFSVVLPVAWPEEDERWMNG